MPKQQVEFPCPADPSLNDIRFGWEYGVTAADLQVVQLNTHFPIGSCGSSGSGTDPVSGNPGSSNPTVGILPFMTLGLPVQMAQDGWNHYFTYAVSPVFARVNDQATDTTDTGAVHGRCRHAGWNDPNDSSSYNRNAVKARFCCADQLSPQYDQSTDLVINYLDGTLLSPTRAKSTDLSPKSPSLGGTGSAAYATISTVTTLPSPNAAVPTFDWGPIEAPAFVLVSHGPHGYGSYLANGTSNQTKGTMNAAETQNQNGDQIFVDGPWNLGSGSQYFDNIIRWMTQDGLLAAHGALSCQYP